MGSNPENIRSMAKEQANSTAEAQEKKAYEGFKNSQSAEKYEMVGPSWRKGIEWPGVFSGKYCDLTPDALAKLVEKKHPDFKEKGAKATVKA